MNRNNWYFKHRSIEHRQYSIVWILGIFRFNGGSIVDLTQYNVFLISKHRYSLLMSKHTCCEYTDLRPSLTVLPYSVACWKLYLISGRDILKIKSHVLQYLKICHKTNLVLHKAKRHKTYYTWDQISKFEVCNSHWKDLLNSLSEFISMKHILYMRHILYEHNCNWWAKDIVL